ncbi:terminase large subunit [Aeromonas phage 85AhydR10PP]|nr:terminase large subunit [Aeromonas phage 85AhydR10PP]
MAKAPKYGSASQITRGVLELVKAPDRTPLSESAKSLLYVDQSGSMVPWDDTLTPYTKEPMDCLKSRKYDSVVYAGPARTGKTVGMVDGWIMDIIARSPADTMLVQMTQDKAAEFRKKRLQRAFDACEEIKQALSPRKSDNNIHDIITRSGMYLRIGWPSKANFASSDFCNVILTDLDRMPQNVDGEGSPFLLASKRTQTFMSRGMVLAESSPGFIITDPTIRPATPHEAPPTLGILSLYNQGDRRLFHWQCHDCGDWFEPTFDLLIWDKDEPDPTKAAKDVTIMCPHCGCSTKENQRVERTPYKQWANKNGIWVPEGCQLDQNGVMTGQRRDTRIASFWQKGPTAAFQTFNSLVYKYASALKVYNDTGDHEDLKTTVNTDQGLPFTPPRSSDRDAASMQARAVDMGVKVAPEWTRFIIASVDVQAGVKTRRWEVQVEAFGPGLESAIIDRFKIEKSLRKDPDNPEKFVRVMPGTYLEDWDLLISKVMAKTYLVDDGSNRRLPVLRTLCDSNGEDGVTDNAYAFWRRLKKDGLHHRFILVKGSSRSTAPPIEKRFPDNTKRTDRKVKVSGDVPVLFLNTNRMKDLVSASLSRPEPGPRYVHFPSWLPESFYDELVAEDRDAAGKWEKASTSSRNEAFDLMGYARAGVLLLKADRITDWDNAPSWAQPLDSNPEVIVGEEEELELRPKRRRRRRT